MLREHGVELAEADAHPTGDEYLRDYVRPLVEAAGISAHIRSRTTVHGVTRRGVRKGGLIGQRDAGGPFLVAVSDATDGSSFVEADVVFDATSVYGQPGALGPGGLPWAATTSDPRRPTAVRCTGR